MKLLIKANPQPMKEILAQMLSYGDKIKLSSQYRPGVMPDFMKVQKVVGKEGVHITILDRLDNHNTAPKSGYLFTYIVIDLYSENLKALALDWSIFKEGGPLVGDKNANQTT